MAKTASLNIRLDADVKKNVESIYAHYGLSLAEAVTVFIHQSCNVGGLPFDLRPVQSNTETLAVVGATEQIGDKSSVKEHKDINELFDIGEKRRKMFGCMSGKMRISDDFDAPFDELGEYME